MSEFSLLFASGAGWLLLLIGFVLGFASLLGLLCLFGWADERAETHADRPLNITRPGGAA